MSIHHPDWGSRNGVGPSWEDSDEHGHARPAAAGCLRWEPRFVDGPVELPLQHEERVNTRPGLISPDRAWLAQLKWLLVKTGGIG